MKLFLHPRLGVLGLPFYVSTALGGEDTWMEWQKCTSPLNIQKNL